MVFKEITVAKKFSHSDAQFFVSRCMRYDSEITLEAGTKKINAKSLMGVISLAFQPGDPVTVITKGDDQEEALEVVTALLG